MQFSFFQIESNDVPLYLDKVSLRLVDHRCRNVSLKIAVQRYQSICKQLQGNCAPPPHGMALFKRDAKPQIMVHSDRNEERMILKKQLSTKIRPRLVIENIKIFEIIFFWWLGGIYFGEIAIKDNSALIELN